MTRSKSARLRDRRKRQKAASYTSEPRTAILTAVQAEVDKTPTNVVPDVPIPFRGLKKRCLCGATFWTMRNYERHYMLVHIIPNIELTDKIAVSNTPNYGMIFRRRGGSLLWKMIKHNLHLCHKQRRGYSCQGLNNYEECGE
jgi:hypothetical protein